MHAGLLRAGSGVGLLCLLHREAPAPLGGQQHQRLHGEGRLRHLPQEQRHGMVPRSRRLFVRRSSITIRYWKGSGSARSD